MLQDTESRQRIGILCEVRKILRDPQIDLLTGELLEIVSELGKSCDLLFEYRCTEFLESIRAVDYQRDKCLGIFLMESGNKVFSIDPSLLKSFYKVRDLVIQALAGNPVESDL